MAGRYGLAIRAAAEADAAGLAVLLHSVGLVVDPRRIENRLAALRGHGTVLLADEWGPPAGAIALGWARSFAADLAIARIDLLAVAPDDRRRGIGRLLLKAGAQAARAAGCGDLVLALPPAAAELRAFAAASGFTEEGAVAIRPLRKRHEG